MIALVFAAHAEVPPPDYREALVSAVEAEADARIADQDLDAALDLVTRFRSTVTDHARLVYEEALVRRLQGHPDAARRLCERAVEMDPTLAAAWYDLGEAALLDGDLDAAEAAFRRATDLTEDHPQGWAGPFRLAEIAARRHDPKAFQSWLLEAIRRGFTFRTVAGDPAWTGFLRDPDLGAVIRRMMTVYGEEALLEDWR